MYTCLDNLFKFLVLMMVVRGEADLTDFQKTKLSDHFITFGVSCIAQNPLNFEDIQALKSFMMPKGDSAFCFFGCVLKKAGLLGSDGKLSPEAVLEVVNQAFQDKDERDKVVVVFTACAYVNDAVLEDDEKGCKRAKLVLNCLIKESDIEDSNDKSGGADRKINTRDTGIESGSFHGVIARFVRLILRVACNAVSTDGLTGQLLGRLIPGHGFVNVLCGFIKKD
nr:Uncharacterized protein/Odorant-binding related protein [Metisa plana]